MSSKPFFKSRLALEMLVGIVVALLLAAGVLLGARELFYRVADQKMPSQESMNRAVLARLQAYVDQKRVTRDGLWRLAAWQRGERYAEVFLYEDGALRFSSSAPDSSAEALDERSAYPLNMDGALTLRLSDGQELQALVYSFASMRYYDAADTGALALAFIVFLLLIVRMMQKKLRYISLLRSELKILEGGDLGYSMTVQGKDELAELAQGIDSMRTSILERQAGEAQAQQANRELIRALSHDLRTPLTSLMGYLDLIHLHRYQDEAQLQHFLKSSRDKAERIRELSDKLFSYFLVYARAEQAPQPETVDAYEFLHQVLGEHVFELESAGFTVETDLPELSATLSIEPDAILRVFENLFGNILKYGDRQKPVSVRYAAEGRALRLTIENAAEKGRPRREGARLGLRTCETVLARHGGSFSARDGDRFLAVLTLPI